MAYHIFLRREHEQIVATDDPNFWLFGRYGALSVGDMMPGIRVVLANEIRDWLDDNAVEEVKMVAALYVDGKFENQRGALYFTNDKEAILFKMRWF